MFTIHLKIISPRRIVMEEDVASVTVPSSDGEITILPRHVRLFTMLKEGIISIKAQDRENYLAIGGGYAETDGKDLNILVSQAYRENEINEDLTRKAVEEAKQLLAQSKNQKERSEAQSMLRYSLTNIKLLNKRKAPASFKQSI